MFALSRGKNNNVNTNNDGINLSITTPRHRIGAVGVSVADVQPPPVQAPPRRTSRRHCCRHASPPHRRHQGGTGRVDPPRRRRVGRSTRRRGGRRCRLVVVVHLHHLLLAVIVVAIADRPTACLHETTLPPPSQLHPRVFADFVITTPIRRPP
jgi:hypothetical protein